MSGRVAIGGVGQFAQPHLHADDQGHALAQEVLHGVPRGEAHQNSGNAQLEGALHGAHPVAVDVVLLVEDQARHSGG